MSKQAASARKPAIIVLGAPGSGKGTQGKVLGKVPRFFHFSSGDVFRALDTRTALGRQFVDYSSRGELVPDELTIELMRAHLDSLVDIRTYKPDIDILVLDGIPRNVEQARLIDQYIDVHHVFHLSCPDRTVLAKRIRKRALKDGRMDDANEAVIQRRFDTYAEETKPILDHYGEALVTDIDASEAPLTVFASIVNKVVTLPIYQQMSAVPF